MGGMAAEMQRREAGGERRAGHEALGVKGEHGLDLGGVRGGPGGTDARRRIRPAGRRREQTAAMADVAAAGWVGGAGARLDEHPLEPVPLEHGANHLLSVLLRVERRVWVQGWVQGGWETVRLSRAAFATLPSPGKQHNQSAGARAASEERHYCDPSITER